MTLALVLRPSAARDISDAVAYHTENGSADAFLAAVDHAFARVAARPLMFPRVYGEVRRALLRRFTYSAFFVLDEDAAVILAVHHQRRDPSLRPKP